MKPKISGGFPKLVRSREDPSFFKNQKSRITAPYSPMAVVIHQLFCWSWLIALAGEFALKRGKRSGNWDETRWNIYNIVGKSGISRKMSGKLWVQEANSCVWHLRNSYLIDSFTVFPAGSAARNHEILRILRQQGPKKLHPSCCGDYGNGWIWEIKGTSWGYCWICVYIYIHTTYINMYNRYSPLSTCSTDDFLYNGFI